MNDESEVLLLLHGGHGVIKNFGESRLARPLEAGLFFTQKSNHQTRTT